MFQSLIRALMPREEKFIERFEKHSTHIVAGAEALCQIFAAHGDFDEHFRTIRQRESAADGVTRETLEAIHRTFITPFDRTEIHDLIVALDDTIDIIEEIAQRIVIYRVLTFTPQMVKLAETIRACAALLNQTMPLLESVPKNADALRNMGLQISTLEGQADATLREGLALLMKGGGDPIVIMTSKEIYELLESAIDRCEDVANVVQGIVIEHG
jgi:uncharacterized protein Yka (UPF0111/DUF47 family)